jgi:c-di-GMP-binding flagellar brake protein YcgR
MQEDEIIIIGEKVDLLGHKNRLYRTKIEDTHGNGFYLVGVPRFSGIPMPVHMDDKLHMVFYRESGRFVTEMKVVGFENRDEIRYTWLHQETEPVRDQRREVFRVPVIFDVMVFDYMEDMEKNIPMIGAAEEALFVEKVSSRDISVAGIAIVSKKEYEIGENRYIKMFLEWPQKGAAPFATCVTVRRIARWRDTGQSIVGMSYFGQTRLMGEHVSRYVLEEQRRQLKQKRLVESK